MSPGGARPVALVPGVLALLPEYASIEDPVAELREACLSVVGQLGPRVRVVAGSESGSRVGASLVEAVGSTVAPEDPTGVLAVGNGSAKRSEKAPGHHDERAEAFDAMLRDALVAADGDALRGTDAELAAELWADVGALGQLAGFLVAGHVASVEYDGAPFGVQYWAVSWTLADPSTDRP